MNFLKTLFKTKQTPCSRPSEFWSWFQTHANEFYKVVNSGKHIEAKFINPVGDQLSNLNADFYLLAGMKDDQTAELIISAEGLIKNFVFVEELIQLAPKLEGWLFTALKPAMEKADFTIDMGQYSFSEKNLFFYPTEDPNYPDEIDITIVYDVTAEGDKNQLINGISIYLDNLLGEYNFATQIDSIAFESKKEVDKELIPIHKLNSYLIWREKEFVEKYQADIEIPTEDSFSLIEGTMENGDVSFTIVNQALLNWDGHANFPWMHIITFDFAQVTPAQFPDESEMDVWNDLEEEVIEAVKQNTCIYIGRTTFSDKREVFFASKDFRSASKAFQEFIKQKNKSISYEIYKDKYWRILENYRG